MLKIFNIIRKLIGVIVAVIFIGLIVGLNRLRPNSENMFEVEPPQAILESSPFRFKEVSNELQIPVQHELYFPYPETKSYLPLMAIPPSISVVDINEDGYMDFYYVQPHVKLPNLFFRNRQGKDFEEIGERIGLADQPKAQPGSFAFFADFNRDGHTDVILARMGCHKFLAWDDGLKKFQESNALPRYCSNPKMVNVTDLNKDGWLDLVFGNYYPDRDLKDYLPLSHIFGQSGYRSGGSNEIVFGGASGFQFSHRDQFREFKELKAHTTAIGIHDYNNDGYPDIFVSNDYFFDAFYMNDRGLELRDVTALMPRNHHGFSGMNSEWADFDNSGEMSLYVTNMYIPPFVTSKNILWKKHDNGFANVAEEQGVGRCGWSWGAKFSDFDNDGHQDLFVINGKARGSMVKTPDDPRKSFSFVRNTLATTPPEYRYNLDFYPDFSRFVQSGFERSCLFWNKDNKFYDVTQRSGINDLEEGQSIALIDYDNDGRMDILVGNNGGPLLMYHNETPIKERWLGVDLKGPKLFRDALGSQARIHTTSGTHMLREKNPANGYRGQNDPRLHFGIDTSQERIDVEVSWWDGKKETFRNLETNRYHQLKYGEGK